MGHEAGLAGVDGFGVDVGDGSDIGGGPEGEDFVGVEELIGREAGFVDGDAGFAGEFEGDLAGDAGEDFVAEGMGAEDVVLDDGDGPGGSFGDDVVADHDRFVAVGVDGGLRGEDVGQQGDGFDGAFVPADIGDGHGGEARRRGVEDERLGGVGHDKDRRRGVRGRELVLARGRASGDLPVGGGVGEIVAGDGLVGDLSEVVDVNREVDAEGLEAVAHADDVLWHGDGLTVAVADDFVDAVGEDEAAIEDADGGILAVDPVAVEVDEIAHDWGRIVDNGLGCWDGAGWAGPPYRVVLWRGLCRIQWLSV